MNPTFVYTCFIRKSHRNITLFVGRRRQHTFARPLQSAAGSGLGFSVTFFRADPPCDGILQYRKHVIIFYNRRYRENRQIRPRESAVNPAENMYVCRSMPFEVLRQFPVNLVRIVME